uniref:Uncharacterized protein n=1 Tax=Rhizophora mucronata TaxID=61149 RepID=A0A2P2NCL6_RHIMU
MVIPLLGGFDLTIQG